MNLRLAKKDDCMDIYLWRNDEKARLNSINKEKISYENHIKWFESVLNNENRIIYIGYDENNKIGQIRFDKNGVDAEVSITINPKLQGKGYGTELLLKGIDKFLKENLNYSLLAEILPSNLASIRIFEKAGFELDYLKENILYYRRINK